MLRLRPLVVVTGTPHVEGGFTSKRRKRSGVVITEDLRITKDRKRANVIVVDYTRRLRKLVILRTPLGLLIDAVNLPVVEDLLRKLTRSAIEFNKGSTTTEITNCMLVEPLAGARRAAVEGWVARRLARGDERAVAARAALELPVAPPPAPAPEAPAAAEPPAEN
jgi:hypothetical protein